jgi:hypothetical protein
MLTYKIENLRHHTSEMPGRYLHEVRYHLVCGRLTPLSTRCDAGRVMFVPLDTIRWSPVQAIKTHVSKRNLQRGSKPGALRVSYPQVHRSIDPQARSLVTEVPRGGYGPEHRMIASGVLVHAYVPWFFILHQNRTGNPRGHSHRWCSSREWQISIYMLISIFSRKRLKIYA